MADRTITNAVIVACWLASISNVTNELILPIRSRDINANLLSAIHKDAAKIQNSLTDDHKTPNRVKYNIELKNYKDADEYEEKVTVGRNNLRFKDILKVNELIPDWNVKTQRGADNFKWNRHGKILSGDTIKRNIRIYNIDANEDMKKEKSGRKDDSEVDKDSIPNERISKLIETPRTDNRKGEFYSDKLAVDSVEINKHIHDIHVSAEIKKDKTGREHSLNLDAKKRLNNAMLADETKRLEVDANFSYYSAGDSKDSIKLSLKNPIGTNYFDTSKSRVKRYDDDDDLYIWDSCEGKLHLGFVNGKFQCVEVSLEKRINFGPLDKCPAGHRRVFISNIFKLCQQRRKRGSRLYRRSLKRSQVSQENNLLNKT